jgi:RNA polymerase sigma factor (sigma-70 family)
MSTRDARFLLDRSEAIQASASSGKALRAETAADGSSLFDRLKLKLSSDEKLAARLQAGQAEALTILFERHSPLVFRNARRILRNDAEAEDLVQQVFFDLLRSADKFEPKKGSFRAWLLMFAYCRTINRWRQLQSSHYFDCANLEDVLPQILQGARQAFPFDAEVSTKKSILGGLNQLQSPEMESLSGERGARIRSIPATASQSSERLQGNATRRRTPPEIPITWEKKAGRAFKIKSSRPPNQGWSASHRIIPVRMR